MEFGGRLSRTAFARMIDGRHEQIRRSVGLLPVYGPADWSGPRTIGRWGWSDGVLRTAGLSFGARGGSGPWVEVVTTAEPAEDVVTEQRTAEALAVRPVRDDATFRQVLDAVAAEPSDEVTIEVDGVPKRFVRWREPHRGSGARPDWYAALVEVPGLVVTGHGLEAERLGLVAVADVEPYLVATRAHLLASYDAAG